MAINSRNKGGRNERDICKWWKDWTGKDFSRVPSSGGLRWKRTADTTGDVICSDNKHFLKFPFSIECKAYAKLDFSHIIKGKNSAKGDKPKIIMFWEQAVSDAIRGDKIPILFMRENGQKKGTYIVAMPFMLASNIISQIYEDYGVIPTHFEIKDGEHQITIMNSDYLKSVSYKKVLRYIKKRGKEFIFKPTKK